MITDTVKAAKFLVTGPLILGMLFVVNLMSNPGVSWFKWAAFGLGEQAHPQQQHRFHRNPPGIIVVTELKLCAGFDQLRIDQIGKETVAVILRKQGYRECCR